MMKRFLVTGGAGFIGSHIARRLLQEGARVWVLDNFLTGSPDNLPKGVGLIEGDITSESVYPILPKEPFDAVFHLAGQSSGPISGKDPVQDLDINAKGTLLLLQWCAEREIPRFLYASSQAVYGDTGGIPVGENHPCAPRSFYGVTKLAAEGYVRIFNSHGLSVTAFRMSNVYGPGQNLDNLLQGMVSIYMAYLLRGEPILVMGSLDRYRDLIYVDDVVEAWIAALNDPITKGKTYNLGSGHRTTVGDLLDAEISAFGYDPETYRVICEGTTHGDIFGLQVDISLLTKDLKWSPEITVHEGILRMSEWVKQSNSYKSCKHTYQPTPVQARNRPRNL